MLDPADEVALAQQHQIGRFLLPGVEPRHWQRLLKLAETQPGCLAAPGVHPLAAESWNKDTTNRLLTLLDRPQVVAIGEIGLDFYRDRSPREVQRRVFREQIRLARELGKPLIVHDRDAHQEVLSILAEEKAFDVGGVLHCFSGDLAMARACVEMGFLISFAGPLTYPKNDGLRAIAAALPADVLLIETDCPYLAPQQQRGRRNEPALVRQTAERLADIKGLSLEDIARITSHNAWRLFGIGQVDQQARIAYQIRDSLYLNITNRCTNRCTFCAKFHDFTVKGHQLCLDHEPTSEEVKAAIDDPGRYREVVFCGYGEPLLRLELVTEVATWLKKKGVLVRINTDGQANLVHGRNILPELEGLVDALSVSLNAADAKTYQKICQSQFGETGYTAVLEFLQLAKKSIPSVTATAVTLPGVDIEACRRIAEQLGVDFRPREYNEVG